MAKSLHEQDEESISNGSFDERSLVELFKEILDHQITGALALGANTENRMFFMRGQPVGVELEGVHHPLGQLLLELGLVGSEKFLLAQRQITSQDRLPGQVFKELGVLDDASLKDVLAVQARKKIGQFCMLGRGVFTFGRGLTFLTGFNPARLDMHGAIFLALERTTSEAERKAFLYEHSQDWIRIPENQHILPTTLDAYGFGPPEEKFLKRIKRNWQKVSEMIETGTLVDLEVAILLKYLIKADWLKVSKTNPTEKSQPKVSKHEKTIRTLSSSQAQPTFESTVKSPRPTAPTRPVPRPQMADSDLLHSAPTHVNIDNRPKPKKRRRTTPEPSVGTSTVTETRREKTDITPLPSIVIKDE